MLAVSMTARGAGFGEACRWARLGTLIPRETRNRQTGMMIQARSLFFLCAQLSLTMTL